MIRPLSIDILEDVLFVPRAIVEAPVRAFSERLGLELVKGEDNLDQFEGLILILDEDIPFTLTCHRGHAPGQTTLSLPVFIGEVSQCSEIIERIASALDIDKKLMIWQQDRDDLPRIYA